MSWWCACFAALLLCLVSISSTDGYEKGSGMRRYIVKCKNGNGMRAILSTSQATGNSVISERFQLVTIQVNEQDAQNSALYSELSKNTDIELIEEDVMTQATHWHPPVHDNIELQAAIQRHLQSEDIPYGINMVGAPYVWAQNATRPRKKIKICVVDTGYGLGHEDLPNDNDHNVQGWHPDDIPGHGVWNVDGNCHGTHVAGTIGAIGSNNIGVVGVNNDPDKFEFFIAKALSDEGSAPTSVTMRAVEQCAANGAKVINLSLGSSTRLEAYEEMLRRIYDEDGILIIASAGNGGDSSKTYPASYPHAMSVAAVRSDETRSSFSQFNDQVEIAGPGSGVRSTVTADGVPNGYGFKSGTSMAAPHVSGVAALVWSHFPECSNHQIRSVLLRTARDKGDTGCDNLFGFGIVDAEAAYKLLSEEGCTAVGDTPNPPSSGSVGGCAQFDNVPQPTPPPTAIPDCTAMGKASFELILVTDFYPREITWEILDKDGNTIHTQGPYGSIATTFEHTICLDATLEPFTFIIKDSNGDGICCSYGEGSYRFSYQDEVVGTGAVYGSSETTMFPEPPTTQPTSGPTSSPTVVPTSSPTSSPSLSPTSSPSLSPTSSPSLSPTSSPSLSPTASPRLSPTSSPTLAPTSSPTSAPTSTPSLSPASSPTLAPTSSPKLEPTSAPTLSPTSSPTLSPTSSPSLFPTTRPRTSAPNSSPTSAPTSSPEASPTSAPTSSPTSAPTSSPTFAPTSSPAFAPTSSPTSAPTSSPTSVPTSSPTSAPTSIPTSAPTSSAPSHRPTNEPSSSPTSLPSTLPTGLPTSTPTDSPVSPTLSPTEIPTALLHPTPIPTLSRDPTSAPSDSPTQHPTKKPTQNPTKIPTKNPTKNPTQDPTKNPTVKPTEVPSTTQPTAGPVPMGPTKSPSAQPVGPTLEPFEATNLQLLLSGLSEPRLLDQFQQARTETEICSMFQALNPRITICDADIIDQIVTQLENTPGRHRNLQEGTVYTLEVIYDVEGMVELPASTSNDVVGDEGNAEEDQENKGGLDFFRDVVMTTPGTSVEKEQNALLEALAQDETTQDFFSGVSVLDAFAVTPTLQPTEAPTTDEPTMALHPTESPTTDEPTMALLDFFQGDAPTTMPAYAPTKAPIDVPTKTPASDHVVNSCTDEKRPVMFFTESRKGTRKCSWLSRQKASVRKWYCRNGKMATGTRSVKEVCGHACGKCDKRSCQNNDAKVVFYKFEKDTCRYLRSSLRRSIQCIKGSQALRRCPESCGKCANN